MDFFQHQQQAKNRTFLLVVLYGVALFLLIAAFYAIVACCYAGTLSDEEAMQFERNFFIDPLLLFYTISGVSLIVFGGSFVKTMSLASGGGKSVAEMLGGRLISPGSVDLAERRLYNIVEEMSLASGVPVPSIYVMDHEPGINAFAAGFAPNEAVISVNRGTMELLTRDELQGVIAHEFSHILNGDMRLNLRLIGILFGLQLLVLVGYYAMRFANIISFESRGSGNNKNNGAGAAIAILGAGLVLMILGYIGMLFSAIIKAAISRQREFLADSSAVQFTRNPDGIAGALKKIGCPSIGSDVKNEHAAEASHLFFGNVCSAFSFGEMFATHPNLTTRIRRIDPSFDGKFPSQIFPVNIRAEADSTNKKVNSRPTMPLDPFRQLNPLAGAMQTMGLVNMPPVTAAEGSLENIPEDVADEARNPLMAKALFYMMLLDSDSDIRQKQIAALTAQETPFILQSIQKLSPRMNDLAADAKIPLAQRMMASLRQLTPAQYKQFVAAVDSLIVADNKIDLFEYTIRSLLLRDLDIHFGLAKPLLVKFKTLESVRKEVVITLTYLALAGHENRELASAAFESAQKQIGLSDPICPNSECTVTNLDRALRVLAETTPTLKKQIYQSFLHCVDFDGKVTVKEGELMRAIAAMMAIPMPNFK
ncbi:MAG: M48 family metallopeptidase [Thermoguttaceae bacterium]